MRGNEHSLIRAVRGPITLITLGVLFALNNFTPYQFHQTWPVLLIVFGLLSLVRRGIEPPQPAAQWNAPPPPQYQYPQPPASSGGYRQSSYPEAPPPASPAKGGFGSTSSTQRPADPGENSGGTA